MDKKIEEKILSQEEFDEEFRKAMKKIYPKQMAEGKIFETESRWYGIGLKKNKQKNKKNETNKKEN